MWIDFLVSAPVTLFLIWLYWYSRPRPRPNWLRLTDTLVLILAPLAVIVIIGFGHQRIDYPGTGLHVMLVAAAYITLVMLLGLGWLLRAIYRRPVRSPFEQEENR